MSFSAITKFLSGPYYFPWNSVSGGLFAGSLFCLCSPELNRTKLKAKGVLFGMFRSFRIACNSLTFIPYKDLKRKSVFWMLVGLLEMCIRERHQLLLLLFFIQMVLFSALILHILHNFRPVVIVWTVGLENPSPNYPSSRNTLPCQRNRRSVKCSGIPLFWVQIWVLLLPIFRISFPFSLPTISNYNCRNGINIFDSGVQMKQPNSPMPFCFGKPWKSLCSERMSTKVHSLQYLLSNSSTTYRNCRNISRGCRKKFCSCKLSSELKMLFFLLLL
jgi:hypothetical protein